MDNWCIRMELANSEEHFPLNPMLKFASSDHRVDYFENGTLRAFLKRLEFIICIFLNDNICNC